MTTYPNPPPFRLQILMAITRALDEISPTTGYNFDLTPYPRTAEDGHEFTQGRNFRGRVVFGDDDPLPMTSVLEVVIPPDQFPGAPDNPNRHGDWDLMVQGFVPDDFENPTDPAQYLLADVVQRLAKELPRVYEDGIFGFPAITALKMGVGVVRPPDEVSAKAYFWLPISLTLVEDLSNPYDNGQTAT